MDKTGDDPETGRVLTRRRLLLGGSEGPSLVRPEHYGIALRRREAWAVDRPQLQFPGPESVRFLLVHHSASSNEYEMDDVPSLLRGFYDYHTGNDKGWADVAYNFLIDRFGEVWEGRDGSVEGPVVADATGGNQGFAQLVCLIGDFTDVSPTAEALTSLRSVLAWLADRYEVATTPGTTVSFVSRGSNRWPVGVEVSTATIAGHRDMSLTTCPGDALNAYVGGDLMADIDGSRRDLHSPSAASLQPASTSRPTRPATTPPASVPFTVESELPSSPFPRRPPNPWAGGAAVALALLMWILERRRSAAEAKARAEPRRE